MAFAGDVGEHPGGANTILSLHEMFRIIGDQLSIPDVRLLKCLYLFPDQLSDQIVDGRTFLLAMEESGRIDESNFLQLLRYLRLIRRHDLVHRVTLQKIMPVTSDPVCDYLEKDAQSTTIVPFQKSATGCASTSHHNTPACGCPVRGDPQQSGSNDAPTTSSSSLKPSRKRKLCRADSLDLEPALKQKVTCDVRLRVRAEYCHHSAALDGNVHSIKAELTERQFERFSQANTILRSRDLGSIMCDIKFCELTYLDAFWRDYINGSLLDALKGVFITETLKQAVGHEAIKLLVNIDEDDYEIGRRLLLENLK